ncbi:hypothetical protein CHS0354_027306 [Potamilus streckersoni]|uniref:WSC domain-containing protein n=1 Tax=Potamilus streckersoni TaxID=2493646 RepID=A0AAE0TFF2_9BIVA|nr:hypothetical protein CHS0354_027306 [Potamilus streckersoni]
MLKCRTEPKMKQFYCTLIIIIVWFGMDINDYPGTTATWVSLQGCYITVRQNSSLNLTAKMNGPRHCFDACRNSTYVGLQDSWCMCDIIGENYALPRHCNSPCSGERDMLCGSHPGIAVFSKVNQAQSISVSGDFGCVYVHVSVPSNGIGHNLRFQATNNCSEERFYAYFDDLNKPKCVYERALESWFKARDKFVSVPGSKFLLPEQFVRDEICPPQTGQGSNIDNGEFWIGMIWIKTGCISIFYTVHGNIGIKKYGNLYNVLTY